MKAFMPIGIIQESIADGATFDMLRPDDKTNLKPGDSIVICHRLPHLGHITAQLRGEITEVAETTAALKVTQADLPNNWPEHVDPKGHGNAVYLAIPGTYMPDLNRPRASAAEFLMLLQFARDHERANGTPPSADIIVPLPVQPNLPKDPMNHQE